VTTGAATWEGKSVTIGQIDGQLQRLYRAADSEWDGEGRRPDIRASVLNLVVYARDQGCCDRTISALAQLSGTHPSRAIVILPGKSHDTPSLDCKLSIQSHGAYAEFRQVCSEQVILEVHGQASQHLASIVQPLLVPDLPVFLWWPGENPVHHHVYGQLRNLVDRFIVDSSDFPNPIQDVVALSHAVRAASDTTAFSDFNWARLAPWRELIAQFFDAPQYRPYLDRLTVMWVECSPAKDRVIHVLPQVLLLGGWLASSLGLHAEQRIMAEDHYELRLGNGSRKFGVNIRVGTPRDRAPVKIRLEAPQSGESPHAEFDITIDGKTGEVTASAAVGKEAQVVHKSVLVDRTEAHLLFEDLEMFGHDPGFEKALYSAATMLDPNYHREPVKGSLLV
jgi:glucose-6-phosphate dehydrogenase assembly protein OpcA